MLFERAFSAENLLNLPRATERFRKQVGTFGDIKSFFCRSPARGGSPYAFQQRVVGTRQSHRSMTEATWGRRLNLKQIHPNRLASRRMKRAIAGSLCLIVVLTLGYLFHVAKDIEHQSDVEEARAADIIIVLGAAEYRGRPSPVLQARLNHALTLYRQGLAPYLLTTGGSGGDPVYTEGEVGRAYLTQHGVPSEAILVEPEGSTTAQSLASAVEIMKRMNFKSCVVVSDGYHIFRVKRMLEGRGITV